MLDTNDLILASLGLFGLLGILIVVQVYMNLRSKKNLKKFAQNPNKTQETSEYDRSKKKRSLHENYQSKDIVSDTWAKEMGNNP